MADGLPPIQMDFNAAGDPVVIVEQQEVTDPAQILSVVPGLSDPALVIAYAQLVNHLAQGDRYELILDPAGFKDRFMAQWDAEDADAEPIQGSPVLHDFGIPDFGEIARPSIEGGVLTFYAQNVFMKMPYKAVLKPGGKPEYTPVRIVE
jgi:hypothetical protein